MCERREILLPVSCWDFHFLISCSVVQALGETFLCLDVLAALGSTGWKPSSKRVEMISLDTYRLDVLGFG